MGVATSSNSEGVVSIAEGVVSIGITDGDFGGRKETDLDVCLTDGTFLKPDRVPGFACFLDLPMAVRGLIFAVLRGQLLSHSKYGTQRKLFTGESKLVSGLGIPRVPCSDNFS